MNNFIIRPSSQTYKSAPILDQQLPIVLEEKSQNLVEFDRTTNVSLAQVYDNERQSSTIFRPTVIAGLVYSNEFYGTTDYVPFRVNLYYVNPEQSTQNNVWRGYPQYYEFDFFRGDTDNTHIGYFPKSAYSYNWTFNFSYAYDNDYEKNLSAIINNTQFNWIAKQGIPFTIAINQQNGNNVISFQCICAHGLAIGESVEIIVNGQVLQYRNETLFEVYSLGNGLFGSDEFIFNLFDIGYTGNTFNSGVNGTFRRVTNYKNPEETKSKYYIRKHRIILDNDNVIINRTGFEKTPFIDDRKLELSSITPNKITRISQKTSSNVYTFTPKRDIDLLKLIDNQKRPVSELYLTIINRGYSGYFNRPVNNVGLKQGWQFNITKQNNFWWNDNNVLSNTNIGVESYTKTSGVTKTFYYNKTLVIGDVIDGDFCEWNDYEQAERVVSTYYQKIKFNQQNLQTVNNITDNAPGYYYKTHSPITIKVFSDYVETANPSGVQDVPTYSYFSSTDQQFRWRDIYTYGFFDQLGRGVDYPYFNNAHYPYLNSTFRIIPDDKGYGLNDDLLGLNIPVKPIIDECE